MAKRQKVKIEKGELDIIVATRQEFVAAFDSFMQCNLCGADESMTYPMYYIPTIDQVYCERCFNLWQSSARYYKVDQKEIDKRLKELEDKSPYPTQHTMVKS